MFDNILLSNSMALTDHADAKEGWAKEQQQIS